MDLGKTQMIDFIYMEQKPELTSSIEAESFANDKKVIEMARAKIATYRTNIESATTIAEVRAALEDYAVTDPLLEEKVVVNFMEGALKDSGETDGMEFLAEIFAGLRELEEMEAPTSKDIQNAVFNYAAAAKVAEILNVQS